MDNFDFSTIREQAEEQIAATGGDAGQLLQALKRATERAERRLDDESAVDGSRIACRAGCKSCCIVNVSVLLPEGLAIAGYLRQWNQQDLEAVIERLDELWRAVRGLTDDERICLSQSCAFLDRTGVCTIYPVRPLLCRSITSTSAEACRQALADHLLDQSSAVLMNLFQRDLFESVYLGVAAGLERVGIDSRSVKLTGLVRYLLKQPQAEMALLSGEKLDWHTLA